MDNRAACPRQRLWIFVHLYFEQHDLEELGSKYPGYKPAHSQGGSDQAASPILAVQLNFHALMKLAASAASVD